MDPHQELYDYDLSSHIITILDWGEETGNEKFIAHHHSNGDNKPSSILVNGLGRFKMFNFTNQTEEFPVARFTVKQVSSNFNRVINKAQYTGCLIGTRTLFENV